MQRRQDEDYRKTGIIEIQKAEELWLEVENLFYARYAVSFHKCLVHYERKEFDLYRKWLKIHLQNREESLGYYFFSGLTDLKEGLIDSTKDKLAKMEALLAKGKPSLLFWQTWHSYLKAEIFLSDGLFEEAVALKDKIPSCGSPADYPIWVPLFITNLPFEKDVFGYILAATLHSALHHPRFSSNSQENFTIDFFPF